MRVLTWADPVCEAALVIALIFKKCRISPRSNSYCHQWDGALRFIARTKECRMRVFISWSGDASRNAAELMKSWLPNVIQQLEVWVSSQDIGKGEKWSAGLWETLSELEFGILMVTKENHNVPWILFEARALSKTVKSRVIPILCGIDRIEIANSPLAQFQNALVMKEEIWQVVAAINTRCDSKIDEIRLKRNFEKWWPDFEKEYKNIKFTDEAHGKAAGGKGDASRFERIESSLEF